MKERIFLLVLVLCHLVVMEEASAKEEKLDGEKDQEGSKGCNNLVVTL